MAKTIKTQIAFDPNTTNTLPTFYLMVQYIDQTLKILRFNFLFLIVSAHVLQEPPWLWKPRPYAQPFCL